MSRIKGCFERLKSEGRKALIPYITAGDPDQAVTLPMMQRLVESGADIIELGIPFSDPMADGPIIQRAAERALEKGTTLHNVLEIVKHFRETDTVTPVVLMGYLNPIERRGYDRFSTDAARAGVDGVLLVDKPRGPTSHDVVALARKHMADPHVQALVVNSGCANAGPGDRGLIAAERLAGAAAG